MTRVLVVPFDIELGAVPPSEPVASLLAALQLRLPRRLGIRVELGEPTADLEGCFSTSRRQYDALALLTALAEQAGAGKVLGLTEADLYLSVFTHVLGAAQLGGAAAVVSIHRLRPEAVGLPPDPGLLEERLLKEAVHELGHTFGLAHCHDPACAMFSANDPDEVDLRGIEYRGRCLTRFEQLRRSH